LGEKKINKGSKMVIKKIIGMTSKKKKKNGLQMPVLALSKTRNLVSTTLSLDKLEALGLEMSFLGLEMASNKNN
jgi:hypothetical protein